VIALEFLQARNFPKRLKLFSVALLGLAGFGLLTSCLLLASIFRFAGSLFGGLRVISPGRPLVVPELPGVLQFVILVQNWRLSSSNLAIFAF